MAEQQGQPGQDSSLFRTRGNLATTNANLYIANNNNPFLVSPYSPPTVATTKAAINSLSSLISTQIGNLSSVIDLNTYTLSISTIRPLPSDAQQTLTIQASTINIDGAPGANMYVSMDSFYNTLNTNYLTVNSTLSVSTITGNANFGNLYGNDVVTSTLTTNSAAISSITASTLQTALYVSTPQLVFSSIMMQPSTLSTIGTLPPLTHGMYINMNGTTFVIPMWQA